MAASQIKRVTFLQPHFQDLRIEVNHDRRYEKSISQPYRSARTNLTAVRESDPFIGLVKKSSIRKCIRRRKSRADLRLSPASDREMIAGSQSATG